MVLVLVTLAGESLIELRQQSWGEGVGWFTQTSVQLEPSQVAALRQSLGQSVGRCESFASRTAPANVASRAFTPRLFSAESA